MTTLRSIIPMMILALFSFLATSAARADDTQLPGAAADQHRWFVAPATRHAEDPGAAPRPTVFHQAAAMDADAYTPGPSLPAWPEGVAAFRDRAWFILPAAVGDDGVARRPVLSLTVAPKPAFDEYMLLPLDRFDVRRSLPGVGRFAGTAATDAGLYALLEPEPRASVRLRPEDGSVTAVETLAEPTLLRLVGSAWNEIDLPDGLDPGATLRLAAIGDRLTLFAANRDDDQRVRVYRYDGEAWSPPSIVEHPAPAVGRVTWLESRGVLSATTSDRRISIDLLGAARVFRAADVAIDARRWTALGGAETLLLVRSPGPDVVESATVDVESGAVGEWMTMAANLAPVGRYIHLPIVFGVSVCVLIVLFMTRAGQFQPITPAPGWTVAFFAPRAAALVIDLLPGAFIAWLIFRSPLEYLLIAPVWTFDIYDAAPSLVMIAVAFVHATAMESVSGASMGKRLLRLRVQKDDGATLGPGRTVVRNLGKSLMLAAPPLAVIMVLNPNRQGIGDLLARALVVTPGEPPTVSSDA